MKLFCTLIFVLSFKAVAFSQGCEEVKKRVDKFNGDTEWTLPNTKFVRLSKNYDATKGETLYLGMFMIPNDNLVVNEKGLYILFADGEKILFPTEKVNTRNLFGGQTLLGMTVLTTDAMKKLSTIEVEAIKLYIYDRDLTPDERKLVMKQAQCLLVSK